MTIEFKDKTLEAMQEAELELTPEQEDQLKKAYQTYRQFKAIEAKAKTVKLKAEDIMDDFYADISYMVTTFSVKGKGTIYHKENSPKESLDKAKLIQALVVKGVDIDIVNECIKKATKKER